MADQTDIEAARAAVRAYCGWHVTPVNTDEVLTLDGPGGPVLFIPTLRLLSLAEVVEDGVSVDVSTVRAAADGRVRKRDGTWWTDEYGSITVKVTHGYDEVPNFDRAVEALAASFAGARRNDPTLVEKQVDDVRYRWDMSSGVVAAVCASYGLDMYRLELQP
ncbi:head-to-tail adaptor [Mycobacterium phage Carcharodon]|uniref:Head-to-tail adaptor n=1 Tax=Mycobacterium phage Carcharodon TaxID=1555233 RepID=A0A097EYL8_9CAUD|nr:head-tail adaptor [Mycobacterium phage Carcharodon]AIT14516.1 head-to-tail adaptor [Mycobacterium phage Carcharodon]AWY04090.1 head-to-tail adaptor [Mycobacterium phage Silvafighter]UXE04316.1 head-to-tail adaptor [Mycobacterium phage Phloss]